MPDNRSIPTISPNLPSASIQRWQFEESLNALRRHVPESAIRFHWPPTGRPAIDATARAHISEWLAIDCAEGGDVPSPTVVDALVHRATVDQPWDIYVVEAHRSDTLAVRRLRDHRGFQVRWLEGRTPPPEGLTVGLRLFHLDTPGLWACTLPLRFDAQTTSPAALVLALLRSFGAHQINCWQSFMSGPGARVMLEYALSSLRQRAVTEPAPNAKLATDLGDLDEAYRQLETALQTRPHSIRDTLSLEGGCVAWLEDCTDTPHLMIFDSDEDRRRYQQAMRSGQRTTASWRRIHRASPGELSPVEYALAALADLRPARDGLVRLRRRNRQGHLMDVQDADRRIASKACRQMARSHLRRAG